MNKLIKYTGYLLFLPLWWIQYLIPRNKNVWVFGAWYGDRFSDNSRYLFDFVRKNHPEIKAIWVTRDKAIRDKVTQLGGRSYLTNSLRGIYYSLMAKNVMVSSGKRDVNFLCINGANWIHLWHGNPLKKIGLDDKFSNINATFQRRIIPVLFPFVCEFNYDYVVSNGPAFTNEMASAFNMPLARIWETGCPRNDVFYSDKTDAFNDGLRARFKDCKLIYYLPTFRSHHATKSLFTLDDYNLEALESFLEKENMVFVSKGHYVDNQLNSHAPNPDSRLVNLSDENVSEINFMFKDADLLITDYSSAYFDFLLTQKPIVFAAFDLEEYLAASREMYFEYTDIIAGPVAKTWEQLFYALGNVWSDPKYRLLLKEKNAVFNKYHDAHNSRRVFEALSGL
tara:strand:- start:6779 stop:7963 length:1185 start_codon:yes stop_codon:yes gene_type:complete